MTFKAAPARSQKKDSVLCSATELAREAAQEIAYRNEVGEHLGCAMLDERLAVHEFTCTSPGYIGWTWRIVLSRAPRSRTATVCEANLLPGIHAVKAPDWVPYADRIQAGDVGPEDFTPYKESDPNLEKGHVPTGDETIDETAHQELSLGRTRVLSAQGISEACSRWYNDGNGPKAAVTTKMENTCQNCGFMLPMAGRMKRVFGVCACELSSADGQVVALEYGCGAHSEVDIKPRKLAKRSAPIIDDNEIDIV